jgi:hypothetical protein
LINDAGQADLERDVRTAMLAAVAMVMTAAPAWASWDFKILPGPLGKSIGVATLVGEAGEIAVRCDTTGQNSLFFTMRPSAIGAGWESDFMRATTYRIDGGPVRRVNAIYDSDEITIVNLVRGLMGGDLLSGMLASKTLSFVIVDKAKREHTLLFHTEGAQDAVLRVAQACADPNWTTGGN